MAPRKVTNKKTKASAKSKTKAPSKKKEKVVPVVNPLEKVDKQVSSVAVLGERRDNALRLSKETHHDFDLATILPRLLQEHPDCDVWISGGSPELATLTQSIPNLVNFLVPYGTSPPPFVAYKVKDELIIEPLAKYKLFWHNVAPRVYFLKSTRRMTKAAIQAMTDDSMAKEEHVQLWTLIPREQLQRDSTGRLDVRFANFSIPSSIEGEAPITGCYEKGSGTGLQATIDMLVEEWGEEIGDDAESKVKGAIQKAFADERQKLEEQKELLENAGYSEELLDSIKTVKLYPKGTNEILKDAYINAHYNRADEVIIA